MACYKSKYIFLTIIGSNDYIVEVEFQTFTPGEVRKCFSVNTMDDELFEENEQLNLTLDSSVPHISHPSRLIIIDNDGKGHDLYNN